MRTILRKYRSIATHAIPTLLAIMLAEIVTIEVIHYGPFARGEGMLLLWETLQTISAFIFGYISDQYFRKKTLVVIQVFGVIGGIILSLFGFEVWVVIIIGLTFTPLPVARAALLDNYPHHSALKLVAITFIAQFLPWGFYEYLTSFPYKIVLQWTLIGLSINSILTYFFFKDNYDLRSHPGEPHVSIDLFKKKKAITATLIAFILSEITFFLLQRYIEANHDNQSWLAIMTFGTMVGVIISMFYTRLPHLSIITLFYSIGAAITFVSFTLCFLANISCKSELLQSMSAYMIIGGLYMPFVTDAVITMTGAKRKAFGAALIESGQSIAALLGSTLYIILGQHSLIILGIISVLYTLATISQRYAERESIGIAK